MTMEKWHVNRYRRLDADAYEVVTVWSSPSYFATKDMAAELNRGAVDGVSYRCEMFSV